MGCLAASYLEQCEEILDFWTEYIDEDSNKLLPAVTACLDCLRFHQGCSIYKTLNDTSIQSLLGILGVDQAK